MQVAALRDALNANAFKSVVMVADFCYSSMVAMKANVGLPKNIADALPSSDGIVVALGDDSALQTRYCTCKGTAAVENNVLKSNILFFGAPKYLEANGAHGYNPNALAPAMATCAEARRWLAGELFALPTLSAQVQEEFRACLPKSRIEIMGAATIDLESECSWPDVCMYQGVPQQ